MTIQKTAVEMLLALAVLWGSAVFAAPGESVVRDPATCNYTITYQGYESTELFHTRFIPATKIDPLTRSSFKLDPAGNIVYRYTVVNGHKSKQGVSMILIDPVSSVVSSRPLDDSVLLILNNPGDQMKEITAQIEAAKSAIATPAGWNPVTTASRQSGLRIGWAPNVLSGETDGIKPGKREGGFGFTSTDLPGVQMMRLRSRVSYPDDPSDAGDEFMDPKQRHCRAIPCLGRE
jgi:hypothetical protein